MIRILAYGLLVILLFAGWNQPFRDHYARIMGVGDNAAVARATRYPSSSAMVPVSYSDPNSTRDASWMRQKGVLDANYGKKKATH